MDVGMEGERLPPGVQNGQGSHVRSESRGAKVEQGLTRAAKQNGVDDLGRQQSENVEDGRDGEDDVRVGNVEHFVTPRVEPSFPRLTAAARTVPVATRVPEDVLEAARVTAVAMTAEGGRATVGDGAHHLALGGAQREPGQNITALCTNDGAE